MKMNTYVILWLVFRIDENLVRYSTNIFLCFITKTKNDLDSVIRFYYNAMHTTLTYIFSRLIEPPYKL